jgi:hypothetical protein
MMEIVIPRVVELFDSTCEKQLESMECQSKELEAIDYDRAVSKETVVTVYIDAASDDLDLKLYLTASRSFLASTMPIMDACESLAAEFEEDWCLELANRFLGRLKNKLVSHNCILKMGLPKLSSDDLGSLYVGAGVERVERLFEKNDEGDNGGSPRQILCNLLIEKTNKELILDDYEDEDEDWFDESELEHL